MVFRGADHGVERGVEQDYERGAVRRRSPKSGPAAGDRHERLSRSRHSTAFRSASWCPAGTGWPRSSGSAEIRVIDHGFEGFQHQAYRLKTHKDDVGTPITRIEPRALMSPPGFPDFMSRDRVVEAGPTEIRGRAWSGWGPVTRVEFSPDDGQTWSDCTLQPDNGAYAWRAFSIVWEATPGSARLRVRATDATGRVQPLEPVPTLGGFTNNADEPVVALVR